MNTSIPVKSVGIGSLRYGSSQEVEVIELPVPTPGERQILVRVHGATLNPADLMMRAGDLREFITGGPPYVPGLELSGEIVAIGPNSRWNVGERVAAITHFIPGGLGAHREYVVVHDDSAGRVFDGLSMMEAATIPMSGLTARLALDRLNLPKGSMLAVSGAGGAVGAFVTELAVRDGLEVVALAGQVYHERLKQFGAVAVSETGDGFTSDLLNRFPRGVDAVIDAALMGETLMPLIKDGGQFIVLRPYEGATPRGIMPQHISVREYGRDRDRLQGLLDLAAANQLTMNVARILEPAQGRLGHDLLEAGGVGGRIVFRFA